MHVCVCVRVCACLRSCVLCVSQILTCVDQSAGGMLTRQMGDSVVGLPVIASPVPMAHDTCTHQPGTEVCMAVHRKHQDPFGETNEEEGGGGAGMRNRWMSGWPNRLVYLMGHN